MPRVYPAGFLIEEFPIKLRNGRTLKGLLTQTHRATGRRLRVVDPAGAAEPVFDSGDCYDLGNATNKLDFWIAANDTPPADLLAKFVAGWEPTGPSLERTYYDHWRKDLAGPPLVCDVCRQVMDTEDQGQRTADTLVCSPCIAKGGGVRLGKPAAGVVPERPDVWPEGVTGDTASAPTNFDASNLISPDGEATEAALAAFKKGLEGAPGGVLPAAGVFVHKKEVEDQ